MIIQKIFSDLEEEEKIYSALMTEEELSLFSEYIKGVTAYDRTDRFKQMKDSDILAENKRSNARAHMKTAKSGLLGGTLGAVGGAFLGKRMGLGVAKGAALLGTVGAGAGVGVGRLATRNERNQNNFVNRRLKEAKRQAVRREARDWGNTTVNREGYSY